MSAESTVKTTKLGGIYNESHVGGKQASHRVSDQDNIGIVLLVGLQPGAELVSGHVDGLVGLVPGIYLGVDDVRLAQLFPQEVVNVCGEGAERGVVAHEAMDVDYQ